MPTQTELALSSLLPTLSILPRELINLSTSLLAQSRAKAASLKPEEEIGRTYACCHIACERLRNKLGLEVVKAAPPVKPRVYKKLHAYLDSVLKTTSSAPQTPKKDRKEDKLKEGNAVPSGEKNAVAQPSFKNNVETVAPSRKRKADQGSKSESSTTAEIPAFVMPLIRHICKDFVTPAAAPHVFAGTESVLRASEQVDGAAKRRRTSSRKSQSGDDAGIAAHSIPALVLTIFIAVSTQMYGADAEAGDEELYCAEAIKAARGYLSGNASQLPFEYDESMDMVADIKRFNKQMLTTWSEMEWYQNVPDSAPETRTTKDDLREEEEEDEGEDEVVTPAKKNTSKTPLRRKEKHAKRPLDDEDVGAAGLLPGLGTMFQPAIDWLSEERKADFARWKKGALQQIAIIEQMG